MKRSQRSGRPPCLPAFKPHPGRQGHLPLRRPPREQRALVVPSFVAVALLALSACDNMDHQSNARPLESSPHFANDASAQPPPAHTVARGSAEPNDVFTTGLRHGALTTELPVPLTRELLARGRDRFNIYCAICHGADGYGRGIVVRRGFPPPPSYHEQRLRDAPIGHFFDVITRGYGVMYSYADRVSVSDRWAIAAYIRALQRSQHATLADVPAAQRPHLAAK